MDTFLVSQQIELKQCEVYWVIGQKYEVLSLGNMMEIILLITCIMNGINIVSQFYSMVLASQSQVISLHKAGAQNPITN